MTNIKCKSIDDEPYSERMYIYTTPSMKAAIIERVIAHRKKGESTHGEMSKFIREAIALHLASK